MNSRQVQPGMRLTTTGDWVWEVVDIDHVNERFLGRLVDGIVPALIGVKEWKALRIKAGSQWWELGDDPNGRG